MDPELRAEVMDAVDEVFAEAIRHLPLDRQRTDPSRPVVEIAAVLRTGDRDPDAPTFSRGKKMRPEVQTGGGMLRIDASDYPALQLRKGDKIVALERVGEPIFEILSVDDRSHLRLTCSLGDV